MRISSCKYMLGLLAIVFLAATGLGEAQVLLKTDIQTILGQAVQAANKLNDKKCVIAITDREGFVLAIYGVSGAPNTAGSATSNAVSITAVNAIDKAGTAAFLSSQQEAFTSRTAGFIIQPHFPPGVANTAPGPLVGVGFSSLAFSDINHFRNPSTNPTVSPLISQSLGIPNTTLSGDPGGVPLYKGGVLVGGVGVDSSTSSDALSYVSGTSTDEDVAVVAQAGYTPPSSILATQVLIGGIRLPYTSYSSGSLGTAALTPPPGSYAEQFQPTDSTGMPFVPPLATPPYPQPSPFSNLPGQVRDPIMGSSGGLVDGQPRLSQAEVQSILYNAAYQASITRAAIRNPAGVPSQNFIVVVDYYPGSPPSTLTQAKNQPLTPPSTTPYVFPRPQVLGSFRTPDATIFSYDVAAQKAFTALFFSSNSMAMTTRAVGFLAQATYPPGINGTSPGPYYLLQNQLSVPFLPTNPNAAVNQYLPNGITIFPGGIPLYRNGVLIGAIGVSGDGVNQDDLIAAAGTVNFEAPDSIRSDEFTYRGVRLPYVDFPQDPDLP
jgi:uncharacterized protein GlcG (DUF336 family)